LSQLDKDDRDSTDRILTAGRHLLALINELIDVARVESGELKLSVEPISLHRVTEEVAALMGPLAAARGITIEHSGTGRTLAGYANHQRLRQVMVNLASNAVKYNHHGGMIAISFGLAGADQVEVTDIATGDPATDITPPSPAAPGAAVPDAFVVLSVEDSMANSELLTRLFQSRPATTLHTTSSAHAGIDLACRHHPDLILLDLHLPDMPGEEAFARLQAEPTTADIPIVILSADATPGTVRRLLARGATAYLTKPLDLQELQGVLAAAGAKAGSAKRNRPRR
jgi:CheY-like chemotaxis protein